MINDQQNNKPLTESVENRLRDYFAADNDNTPPSDIYSRLLAEIELPLLRMTMERCRGNQIKAAAMLGLNRNTLRKKLRLLGIAPDRKRSS
jgi:two-component system, NtrC family, nitrogen regulation response regulator GlnG